jgi:hypothetical protein
VRMILRRRRTRSSKSRSFISNMRSQRTSETRSSSRSSTTSKPLKS